MEEHGDWTKVRHGYWENDTSNNRTASVESIGDMYVVAFNCKVASVNEWYGGAFHVFDDAMDYAERVLEGGCTNRYCRLIEDKNESSCNIAEAI